MAEIERKNFVVHRNKWIWGRTWVIVAEEGVGLIKISQDPEDGVVLSGLSVLPDHRGKGIGASLVREAERIVKEEIGEGEDICLSVESWNKELIEWYTKLGFSVYDHDSEYTYLILVNY
jgi:ribosomal protein S18 acetylase RimI-like enzyme